MIIAIIIKEEYPANAFNFKNTTWTIIAMHYIHMICLINFKCAIMKFN